MTHDDESAQAFLAIVDQSPEASKAIRFAALRARRTGARLILAYVLPPRQFVQWGGVQADMEADAEAEGRSALERAVALLDADGRGAETRLLNPGSGSSGEAVLDLLRRERSIRALVLAAAPRGKPGPLINWFAGETAGSLPCMLVIVPGAMSDEDIARLA